MSIGPIEHKPGESAAPPETEPACTAGAGILPDARPGTEAAGPGPQAAADTYPRLVGDVGGTNLRLGLVLAPGAAPTTVRSLACARYPGIREAIADYLNREALPRPRIAALGIANPVRGDHVRMTNHPWSFSVEALRRELGLARLLVVNDFTALALSLPSLRPEDLEQIGGGSAVAGRAIALIGPGTGLGVSGLVPCGTGYTPIEGEGGHVSLPACDAREARLIELIGERFGHVSAERVLSGPGLVALHDAIRKLAGASPQELAAAEIARRALDGTCPHCLETLQTFCAMLGTVAGDLALTLGARGGVYIGGGIVPKLGSFFTASDFRKRFEQKGRFAAYLADIPIWVIRAEHPALLGAVAALESPVAGGCEARG